MPSAAETPQQYIERLFGLVGPQDPLFILDSSAARLRRAVDGRPPDALTRRPAPGTWSIVEVLGHLADSEVVFSWRLRSVLATDGVPLQPYDQDVWAQTFRYEASDPALSLELFDVGRRANLALLRRVDRAAYAHAGMHAERGRESVEHLIRLYAGHDLNHIAQIERMGAAARSSWPA